MTKPLQSRGSDKLISCNVSFFVAGVVNYGPNVNNRGNPESKKMIPNNFVTLSL